MPETGTNTPTTTHFHWDPEPQYKDPFADQPAIVSSTMRALINHIVSDNTGWLNEDYAALDEKARAKLPVKGADFLKAESNFETRTTLDPLIMMGLVTVHDHPVTQNLSQYFTGHFQPPLMPEAMTYFSSRYPKPEHVPYKPVDMKPLEDAFTCEYVNTAPKKNITVDPKTHDEAGLLVDLLRRNPGIAIGDVHITTKAEDLLINNMALLKANHVDTIYVEAPQAEKFSSLTSAQLRMLAHDHHLGKFSIPTTQQWADAYGQQVSEDVPGAILLMMAAAKDNGIRVAYMDKPDGVARSYEAMTCMKHRVASDNFIWTDFIRNDRKDKDPEGKYIVWGGLAHFIGLDKGKGMVAEALGIPLLAYHKSDPATDPVFMKDKDYPGVDFCLSGGKNYLDVVRMMKPLPIQRSDNDGIVRPLPTPKVERSGDKHRGSIAFH
jgi:hypothetical protein